MKLEDIETKTHVRGIEPDMAVRVLDVEPAGPDAVNVSYKLPSGQLLQKTLFREDEAQLELSATTSQFSFRAKPEDFKLAAEATRIRLAHLFDPMMAIHTSDVDPLPHQIAAVYETMLPKQPLRFVLADDPGAGKTIMAGLLIRELMLRGDLQRCLIVAPGSLVEQWQGELTNKFGLPFEILTAAMVESTQTGNPFRERDLLIARLDQLSRKEDWQEKLKADGAHWDLVIVDEAHKLAAHYFGKELKTTKRYDLGKLLGRHNLTRNFLLMTATPHNGKEDDFQAWMALIDEDRFLGKARDGAARADVSDLMRRMVKEELVKFDGTPLFPERIAQTAQYELSNAEMKLYEDVTSYVREQMGRAEAIADGKKKAVVGFALTILQRRLASSPYAISQSLKRRRLKMEEKLKDLKSPRAAAQKESWEETFDFSLDDVDEQMSAEELEEIEEVAVDEATAAKTIPELQKEIEELKLLEKQAAAVLNSGIDKKWDELSTILQSDDPRMLRPDGKRRKMIIFTEHKDTLDYLRKRISAVLGNPNAVIEIHGGTRREDRIRAQEEFRQSPDVTILVATDAAGEGVNLQVANLMVNYDLPWNPNRIEQRFGRIHRIGQTEVCRLWNLVAKGTREGEVFARLFLKLEEARLTLKGKVFDVLGQTFENKPLKDLLMEAILHGEDPKVQAQLFQVVDVAMDLKHIEGLYKRNALTADAFNADRLAVVKDQMEKAEAKKLQPFFLRRFLIEALESQGGGLTERETGRYEVKHVPAVVRNHNRAQGNRRPVLERYDRITFDRGRVRTPLGKPPADLVHPAHPLMASLIGLILKERESSLHAGTVLIDPVDPGTTARLMFLIDHGIREGTTMTRLASRRMSFIEIDPTGLARDGGPAPYLSYSAPTAEDQKLTDKALAEVWLQQDLSQLALTWATQHLVGDHLGEVRATRQKMVTKTLAAVHERLTKEINHWSKRANELAAEVRAGKQPKLQPDNAKKRVEELKGRLRARTEELEAMLNVASNPPVIAGCALILPQGMVDEFREKKPAHTDDPDVRREVELIAMRAVIAAEEKLGHKVKDVSAEKCGWDIWSVTADGKDRFIEVKGRRHDAETITVTTNEVLMGMNKGDRFFLAMVLVNGPVVDGPHYVRSPFTKEPDAGAASVNYTITELKSRAKPAHLA
ncbi:MAG: helicase-related protein [Archangium sp.]|nr:helicase-related protein [Archangium sp.]MDP3575353.1 helicase-related protein [Archangium sp.]